MFDRSIRIRRLQGWEERLHVDDIKRDQNPSAEELRRLRRCNFYQVWVQDKACENWPDGSYAPIMTRQGVVAHVEKILSNFENKKGRSIF